MIFYSVAMLLDMPLNSDTASESQPPKSLLLLFNGHTEMSYLSQKQNNKMSLQVLPGNQLVQKALG